MRVFGSLKKKPESPLEAVEIANHIVAVCKRASERNIGLIEAEELLDIEGALEHDHPTKKRNVARRCGSADSKKYGDAVPHSLGILGWRRWIKACTKRNRSK